ncbi:hypothetical protein H6P81_001639 [Aristolochia fimbriata]|uniref:F-box domain-containing protein n=1 Tax=Aristolochia fimbriata TaxID=158543 RepID=A0AAV7F8M5_ARIFI|nr:hypothetical protein H6P81_001639 [Aristolochia fimbriata]
MVTQTVADSFDNGEEGQMTKFYQMSRESECGVKNGETPKCVEESSKRCEPACRLRVGRRLDRRGMGEEDRLTIIFSFNGGGWLFGGFLVLVDGDGEGCVTVNCGGTWEDGVFSLVGGATVEISGLGYKGWKKGTESNFILHTEVTMAPPAAVDGSRFLLALPDDVLALISHALAPVDLCNLALACRDLRSLAFSDKLWLPQCERLLADHGRVRDHLIAWRAAALPSFKAVCKFLRLVRPLLGLWVHQNPELGNVVYALFGFASVIACRIIPQELGPGGIDGSALLWAPVFEIVAGPDGSPMFFLHGKEKDTQYLYPGAVKSIHPNPNILLLEVEPTKTAARLLHTKSLIQFDSGRLPQSRVIRRSDTLIPRMPEPRQDASFGKLGFVDRRKLLEIVASRVHFEVPSCEMLIEDVAKLYERRLALIEMYNKCRFARVDLGLDLDASGSKKAIDRPDNWIKEEGGSLKCSKSRSFGRDTVGLSLQASKVRMTTYRAWPNMNDNRFALYKLPLQDPSPGREYAGLWGGTFGWPPGQHNEDKPGKALFLLLLSYDESEGNANLIATKILEGTHYVLHPNGSAMFIVKVDEPSWDPFPLTTGSNAAGMEIKCAYNGEGIANGYGFRYPGSKPGSLFVTQCGLLIFVWKESRSVLTLQRLHMEDLLRKGERVQALPPIANFVYLTKSFSNVFTDFWSTTSYLVSSSRFYGVLALERGKSGYLANRGNKFCAFEEHLTVKINQSCHVGLTSTFTLRGNYTTKSSKELVNMPDVWAILVMGSVGEPMLWSVWALISCGVSVLLPFWFDLVAVRNYRLLAVSLLLLLLSLLVSMRDHFAAI